MCVCVCVCVCVCACVCVCTCVHVHACMCVRVVEPVPLPLAPQRWPGGFFQRPIPGHMLRTVDTLTQVCASGVIRVFNSDPVCALPVTL